MGPSTVVLSTHRLPDEAVEVLKGRVDLEVLREPSRSMLEEAIERADVLIAGFMGIDGEVIARGRRLKLIVARSSGVDHIDVEAAERRGVCVANQPEAIAEAVSEHVVGLILASYRRIVEGNQYTVTGEWYSSRRFLRGVTVRGKVLGIVGMGRIGVLTAYKMRMLGVSRIIYYSRRRKREVEQLLHAEPGSLERIFREAHIIVIALPYTRETRGLIGYNLLSTMRPGALFINVGRGPVVDEEALAKVLAEREDLRAALDVYASEPLPPDSPLARLSGTGRVILTPHHAGGTDASLVETSILAARQVLHFLETGSVWNPVNSACREATDVPGLWGPLDRAI